MPHLHLIYHLILFCLMIIEIDAQNNICTFIK